jgi:class 3 adenylate cyclase
MRLAQIDKSVQLASSVEDVWPLIIDTDRLNRLLDLAPVRYTPVKEGSGSAARYLAETTLAGFQVVYEELPFEWAYRREFGVRRRFIQGPLERLELRWKLSPGRPDLGGYEGGSTLSVRFEAVPKSPILYPVAWLGGQQTVGDLLKLGRAIDAYVQGSATNPFALPVSASNRELAERGVSDIEKAGVDKAIAALLRHHVLEAADADCVRMRPYELADQWEQDRRAVLTAFLHSVPAGLLELRWSIVCPSCRTSAAQVEALEDVPADGHCQLCDIAFELDLDRAVEVTFIPHASVRTVPPMLFCIGGPARTPHVFSQVNIDRGATGTLIAPPDPGRYRLFARGGARSSLHVSPEGSESGTVTYADDKLTPPEVHVRPGGDVRIENRGDDARHVKLERLEYGSAAATAHDLALVPEFRTLFSGQLLKRGTPLKVSRTAILFTDLTGSTALYNAVGDAAAFRLVDDHFDVLRRAIGETGGTVVKTMGDAVMAGFPDVGSCIRGAIASLEHFERFRGEQEHGELVHLKLGLFSGACYVVTANGALDYFGQTVNVASRLQHLAESGEIVLEEPELARLDEAVRAALEISPVFEARVKGVDRVLRVVRAKVRRAEIAKVK